MTHLEIYGSVVIIRRWLDCATLFGTTIVRLKLKTKLEETMSLEPTGKAEVLQSFAQHEGDTGSPEVQIALFSARIEQLQTHLREHRHDESSRRGLLRLVGKRRRMLAYLRKNHPDRYREVIDRLGLRR